MTRQDHERTLHAAQPKGKGGQHPAKPNASQRPRATETARPDPRTFVDGGSFQRDLQAAVDAGVVMHLNDNIRLTTPVTVRLTKSHAQWHGLDAHYHTILSEVSGAPAIKIMMDDQTPQGTCARSLMIANLSIFGSGHEEGALVLDDPIGNSWIVNPLLQNIWIEGSGGKGGLIMKGNIFEGNLYSVGTMNCKENGVYFAHYSNGAVLSALRWFGGTNRQNGGHGVLVDAYDGPTDIRYYGLYFCENQGAGISTIAGLELADGCGFENNHGGDAIYFNNYAYLHRCTASTWGAQPTLVAGYAVNPVVLDNCSIYNYGGGEECLANINKGADIGRVSLTNCGSNQRVLGTAEFIAVGNTTIKGDE